MSILLTLGMKGRCFSEGLKSKDVNFFSNPNYDSSEMLWPTHDNKSEYFMDIGTHMIEKNGLYLKRYAIWSQNSAVMGNSKLLTIVALGFMLMKLH